jgi:L-2-hydroxyglutarate oxidase
MLRTTFVVAGGGCVGLATAYQLLKNNPGSSAVVLEKEKKVATHQTGRNSGVVHSGVYYRPGTIKAENCRKGKKALEEFCLKYDIPLLHVGKIIVSTSKHEDESIYKVLEKGKANGVNCSLIGKEKIMEIEPNVTNSHLAIHVPETGIVSYTQVCERLRDLIEEMHGIFVPGGKVVEVDVSDSGTLVTTEDGNKYLGDHFINCGGLYADRIAKIAGLETDIQIVPFKGEYYTLKPKYTHLVKGLIYPVPDPQFPFLGVHYTKMVDGGVECGPNAVLAFAREGYGKLQVNFSEFWEMAKFSGFQNIILNHWKTGIAEMARSLSKKLYVRGLQKLMPCANVNHLVADREPGIRAQAVKPDGTLLDDFLILRQKSATHVINAPSPAATACLTIGEVVAAKALE